MAPEQVERPAEVDHREDIYSLGVVFYQMLTGELPVGRFAVPSKKVQVDVRLDEVVLKALERQPEKRYQQASQVKTEVETVMQQGTRSAEPPAVAAANQRADAAQSRSDSRRKLGPVSIFAIAAAASFLVFLLFFSSYMGLALLPFLAMAIVFFATGEPAWVSRLSPRVKVAAAVVLLSVTIFLLSILWKSPAPMAAVTLPSKAPPSAVPVPPMAAHHTTASASAYAVYDAKDVHYVLYYPGDFNSQSRSTSNAATSSWTDDISLQLKANNSTFGIHRQSLHPAELRINGATYKLDLGRVFVLQNNATVYQVPLFPTAVDIPTLSAAITDALLVGTWEIIDAGDGNNRFLGSRVALLQDHTWTNLTPGQPILGESGTWTVRPNSYLRFTLDAQPEGPSRPHRFEVTTTMLSLQNEDSQSAFRGTTLRFRRVGTAVAQVAAVETAPASPPATTPAAAGRGLPPLPRNSGALPLEQHVARASAIVRVHVQGIERGEVAYVVRRTLYGKTDEILFFPVDDPDRPQLTPVGRDVILFLEQISGQAPGRYRIRSVRYDNPLNPLEETEKEILRLLAAAGRADGNPRDVP
jgi:hypothetical protein